MNGNSRPAGMRVVTTAALVGLGWGLAFGLLDGRLALSGLDPSNLLDNLGRRLLALTFVVVWDAVVWGLVLTLVGLLAWAVLRLVRRQPRPATLLGLYVGLCAALSVAGYSLHRYPTASWLIVAGLALAAGLAAGWLARAAGLRYPTRGTRRWQKGILILGATGLALLLGVVVYRHTVRDWPALNPRVTGQSPTPERPNIVLISLDALRADRLGIYGNEPSPSPRIDGLARRGLVFRQAIAQGNSTVQSIASFLTSLYPTELGMIAGQEWAIDDRRVTLAEALQAGGYRTQAFLTNGHLVANKGYTQGFDGYVIPEPGRPYDLDRLQAETVLAGLACRYSSPACRLFDRAYWLLFDPPLILENEGRRANAQARRFIRLHGDEQFFLWLHTMEPHAAYDPIEPFGSLPAPVNAAREGLLRDWQPSNKTLPMVLGPDDQQALWALYDGGVRDADRLVGEIWDEIEAQGLADRTLLVITADHGDEFADHGDYGHGHSTYQELIHVPLIFVGAGVTRPGSVVDVPVPMLDLLPTLVDVAGAPLPDLVRGQSLLPVLDGAEPPQVSIYSEGPARRAAQDERALIQGDYKLIYRVQLDQAELYNLATDPHEQHDLSAVEPERAAAMRAELRAWTAAALETWANLPQAGLKQEEVDAAMEKALHDIGY